jgi:hypothetical protein
LNCILFVIFQDYYVARIQLSVLLLEMPDKV